MIDLSTENLTLLKKIISEYIPECEIRVFGSRVNGTAKPYSDIDIALKCGSPIDRRTMSRLKEALQESTLPIRIDILDWNSISEEFRGVIEEGYEVI
ncbi:nucleotidyltransferase family protein [uncultured Sulfuricurvum sp.]|uniref:nucleotidyltransferase family protein n=1 Tax=uncultured Sulfuricurvum sp. TaxID=430693 RepID=UPI0026278645|nr:nucleotidyltransferase domain-containing protein [uncultured Sulfuricurvum sp.]